MRLCMPQCAHPRVPHGVHGVMMLACRMAFVCPLQARIFVSSRSASQQAVGKTQTVSQGAPQWRIGFDTTQK